MKTDVKQQEVIEKCLKVFVENGLYDTSSRMLSAGLKLNSGGLYYYFTSKDDAVIACAKQAAKKVSGNVLIPMLNALFDGRFNRELVLKMSQSYIPYLNFLVQVFSEYRYHEKMTSCIQSMNEEYRCYGMEQAKLFAVPYEKIKVCVDMCITFVTSYMTFGDESVLDTQIDLITKTMDSYRK